MCAKIGVASTSVMLRIDCALVGHATILSVVATSNVFVEMRWVALELINRFIAAVECAALLLEFAHVYGWECRGCVVLRGVEVLLVNWNSGVDYVWLDGLLVDDWLDGFVHMVMYVLAGYFRNGLGLCVLGAYTSRFMLELGLFLLEMLLGLCVVTMIVRAVFNADLFVMMLFGKNLLILYRLNCCVVVILMNLLVFYDLLFFASLFVDCLFLDVWCNIFVDGGVVVSGLGEDGSYGCLGFIHDDLIFRYANELD